MLTVPALTRTSALVPRKHRYRKQTFSFQRAFLIAGRKLLDRTWLWHFPSCCWTSAFSQSLLIELIPFGWGHSETACAASLEKPCGGELAHLAFRPAERTLQRAGKEKGHLCWDSSLQFDTASFAMTLLLKQIYIWTQIHFYIYLTSNDNISNNRDENDNQIPCNTHMTLNDFLPNTVDWFFLTHKIMNHRVLFFLFHLLLQFFSISIRNIFI